MSNKSRKTNLLVVDDDPGHLEMLRAMLSVWGHRVETAEDGEEAVDKVKRHPFDLVLTDVRMAQMGGIEALKAIKEYNPSIPVLIMTAYSSVDSAVDALKSGAYDYLTKPLDFDVLKLTVERALDHTRLRRENEALRRRVPPDFDLAEIIGRSTAMQQLIETTATVAPSEATVLITGESGTGKELIARAIHANSERKAGPLVTVNCAALTETLLESELFGHEKGAFTGADKRREGRFMQADKGSIFLDEIGEISPALQAKLLRVLQEREVQRVGSDAALHVDVRVIAATNKDLHREVEKGNFREDLFYRLNVITLEVPPLRERTDDIPVLAGHFMERFAAKNRKQIRGFTPRAMDLLVRHDWPGNVRELENAVERAIILAPGELVTEEDLPLHLLQKESERAAAAGFHGLGGQSLEEVEKQAVRETLAAAGGNKSEAARRLGITRATLHSKIKKYDLADR